MSDSGFVLGTFGIITLILNWLFVFMYYPELTEASLALSQAVWAVGVLMLLASLYNRQEEAGH